MKETKLLSNLRSIEAKMASIGSQMRRETAVAREELADRQRRGLTGDAAIAHYNEWMHRYGMDRLMVREEAS